MSFLISLILTALAVVVSAQILPGVSIKGFGSALVVAVVLGILNAIVKPILILLTLPITIITLGLFLLVINAVIILLVDSLVPGFKVNGIGTAILFAIVLSVINALLQWIF